MHSTYDLMRLPTSLISKYYGLKASDDDVGALAIDNLL